MSCFRNLFMLVFLAFSLQLSGQQSMGAADILKKSMQIFQKNPNFEIDLQYTLFRNANNPVVIEQYKGKLVKQGKNTYLKIHNTEFIRVNNKYLKINNEEKAMEYGKISTSIPQNPLEINHYLNYFADKKVTVENETIRCELTTPKLTQLPYYSLSLFFDKTSFLLKKQVMALVAPGNIVDEKGKLTAEPKFLEIKIKNMDTSVQESEYFKLETYIQQANNSVSPTSKYASYKLIDRSTIK